MRKLNIVLVICIIVSLLLHAITGSMQLVGASVVPQKTIARVTVVFVCAHMIVSLILTVQSLIAMKRSGAGYFKDNLLFWARRISGLTIPIPLIMHLAIFMARDVEAYRLKAFTTGRLISQLLLVAAIALHVLCNVKPALISLGIKDRKSYGADIIFILSVLLLFFAVAFAIYYIRWAAV